MHCWLVWVYIDCTSEDQIIFYLYLDELHSGNIVTRDCFEKFAVDVDLHCFAVSVLFPKKLIDYLLTACNKAVCKFATKESRECVSQ